MKWFESNLGINTSAKSNYLSVYFGHSVIDCNNAYGKENITLLARF